MRKIRQIAAFIGIALILPTINSYADNHSAPSLEDQQIFANKIELLLDAGDNDYALAAMSKYLEIVPDAAPVKRELAHYYMKTTAETQDGLIGHRYPKKQADRIIELLDETVAATPDDHKALSLLVYTHALQGNNESGKRAMAQADALVRQAPWFGYNKALLAISDNRLSDAVDHLAPMAVKRQLSGTKTQRDNIYRSSWVTMRKIALQNPELDPLDAVRDGLVTRVDMNELIEYLHNYDPDGKPIVVNFSSQDRTCSYCVNDLPELYKFAKYSKDNGSPYHIIYAGIEPWTDVNNYGTTLGSLKMRGGPAYNLVHSGYHFLNLSGTQSEALKTMVDKFDQVVTAYKPKVKVLPRKDYILDRVYLHFKNKYKDSERKRYKAYAYAIDQKYWTTKTVYEHATQNDADQAALNACNTTVKQAGKSVECKLYARGRRIIDADGLARNEARKTDLIRTSAKSKNNSAEKSSAKPTNKALAKSNTTKKPKSADTVEQGTPQSVTQALRQFTNIKEHFKAFAVAQDANASVTGTAVGAITQERANKEALSRCEDERSAFSISGECTLHTIGTKEVGDQSEANIQKLTTRQQKRNIKDSPLKSSYRKYRKFSSDKAYAYIVDSEGAWTYGMAFGKRGEDKATAEAMKECEENRVKQNISGKCEMLILNSKFVE